MKTEPLSKTLTVFLRGNLGTRCLAPLTSTDWTALLAAVHVIDLYAYTRNKELIPAFAACVRQMQESTRYFAFHAIAHLMEWNDRIRVWVKADLPALGNVPRCKHEPKAIL